MYSCLNFYRKFTGFTTVIAFRPRKVSKTLLDNIVDDRHLEDHFRSGHQLCEDPLCLAKRFVVFNNGIDLAAHSLSQHPFMAVSK